MKKMLTTLMFLFLTSQCKADNWLTPVCHEWQPSVSASDVDNYAKLKKQAELQNKKLIVFVNNIYENGYKVNPTDLKCHLKEFNWGDTIDHGPSVIVSEPMNGFLVAKATINLTATYDPTCKAKNCQCQPCICPTCSGDCPAVPTNHLKSAEPTSPSIFYPIAPAPTARVIYPVKTISFVPTASSGGNCPSGRCPNAR